VTFRLEHHHPPILTEKEWLAWEELQKTQVESGSADDNSSQPGAGWQRVSELVPAQNKQQITLRLDADLLDFFRSTGRRYQSRINAALREYVAAQKRAV
jgi:uncharacterized protein (DUF4415 family)